MGTMRILFGLSASTPRPPRARLDAPGVAVARRVQGGGLTLAPRAQLGGRSGEGLICGRVGFAIAALAAASGCSARLAPLGPELDGGTITGSSSGVDTGGSASGGSLPDIPGSDGGEVVGTPNASSSGRSPSPGSSSGLLPIYGSSASSASSSGFIVVGGSSSGSGRWPPPPPSSSSGGRSPFYPTTSLIDDMSGLETFTGGYWYTFSDREVPYAEPAALALLPDGGAPPGVLVPPEGAVFPPNPAPLVLGDGTMAYYREFVAGGEATWGAGFGFDFVDVPPVGQSVPLNSCNESYELPDGSTEIIDLNDTGGGSVHPAALRRQRVDGVEFWIESMGVDGPVKVVVNIDDDQTSVWGGVRVPCVTTVAMAPPFECSNSWAYPVLATSTWTQVMISFAVMKPDSNWNAQGLRVGGMHTNKIYNLHWKFETVPLTPLPPVNVGVAMVSFYQ